MSKNIHLSGNKFQTVDRHVGGRDEAFGQLRGRRWPRRRKCQEFEARLVIYSMVRANLRPTLIYFVRINFIRVSNVKNIFLKEIYKILIAP